MAFNVPSFSLSGQPGISQNWAQGMLGVRQDKKREQRADEVLMGREQAVKAAQTPEGGVDWAKASEYLLGTGDVEGARYAGSMASENADRQFREQRAQTQDRQWQASHSLASQNAGRSDFDIQSVKNPDGSERLLRVNKRTGEAAPIEAGGGSGQPVNPYYTGKFTGEQGKVAGYADRLSEADKILSDPAVVGAATSRVDQAASKVPVFGNNLVSTEYQKYDQAQRNFINAVLRRESGAVISPEEFQNAAIQYFPQPGDGPEKLQQKAQNRRTVYQNFARESGPNYQPRGGGTPPPQAVAPQGNRTGTGVQWSIEQ